MSARQPPSKATEPESKQQQQSPAAAPALAGGTVPALPAAEKARLMSALDDAQHRQDAAAANSAAPAYSSRVRASNAQLSRLSADAGLTSTAAGDSPAIDSGALFRSPGSAGGAAAGAAPTSSVRGVSPSRRSTRGSGPHKSPDKSFTPPAPHSSLSRYLPVNHPFRVSKLALASSTPGSTSALLSGGAPGRRPGSGGLSESDLRAIQDVYTRLTSHASGIFTTGVYCKKLTSRDIDNFMRDVGGARVALFHLQRLDKLARSSETGAPAPARRFKQLRDLKKWVTDCATADLNALVIAADQRAQCEKMLALLTSPECVLLPQMEQAKLGIADMELLLHVSSSEHATPEAVLQVLLREGQQHDQFAALVAAALGVAKQIERDASQHATQLQQSPYLSLQAGPTSQAILQQEALAALEHERREAEYAESQARADAQADAEQGRRDADAAARAAAEAARQAWLHDSANFPPATLSAEPYTAEEEAQLLSFLTHADNTLLSEEYKMHLSSASLRQLVDPARHWGLEMLLVHLQHLNITGREFTDLPALKSAVEHAENYKADDPAATGASAAVAGSSAASTDASGVSGGGGGGGGGYAIRRKIFLFLHKPTVEIYPAITWAETEKLFVSSLAGPRLGSILYRLDQIGIAFPDFASLLAHVSEIYARKSGAHSKNCAALQEELSQLQSATFFEPRNEAEEINPRIERVPLLLEPLAPPSLGLTKRLLDLGFGLSNLLFLLGSFSRARFQFDELERLLTELRRAYARMQQAARRAQSFLQSTGVPGRIGTASGHVINGCVLASGPLPLKVLKESNAARAKRERLTLSGHAAGGIRRTAPTFLSNISLADAERLVRESDVLQWVPSPGVRALGHASPDPDLITGLLVNLNNQVELQIKPAYTTIDSIIADVKALHTANWPKEDGGAAVEEGDDAADDDAAGADGDLASEADARAREARRKARARKRAKLVAAIIHSTREWLLSSDCAVLRRKKDGFTISDAEVQSLLAAGGGSFESVKGHCRQLADQRIHVATVAELLVSVSYSHQLALEQQKEHRRIIFNCLRDAGLLDPAAFPPAAGAADVEYISDRSAALDSALNALLYFNTSGQHPSPRSNASRSNYFFAPLQTMLVLHFVVEVMAEAKRSAAIAIRAQGSAAGASSAGNAAEELKAQQESSAATRKPRPATALRPSVADADGDVVDHRDAEEAAAFLRQGSPVAPVSEAASGAGSISPEEEKLIAAQVVCLTGILHSIHTVYTAYLHAKKQVHAFFRSDKCELAVLAPESAAVAAASSAAAGGPAAGAAASVANVNLLKSCTLADVESLFEGAQVGLNILPYLMELSFHGGGVGAAAASAAATASDAKSRKSYVATTSFPSWFALKSALAKLHQRKMRQRVERDSNRRTLAAFLASPDNKILRPGSLQPASGLLAKNASMSSSMDEALLTPLEWSDFDLDAVLECVGHSAAGGVEGIINHMRALSRDVVVAARIHTVAQLLGEIQTAERNQLKHEQAILAFLVSPQGCRLVLTPLSPSSGYRRAEEAKSKEASRAGSRTGSRTGSRANSPRSGAVSPPTAASAAGGGRSKATLADVKRLYVDGTAAGRTLPYLHQFASEKKSFHSWAMVAEQVALAHAAVCKQESKEKTVLAGFFEAQAGSLFANNNGGKLSAAEIDSIHLEKGLSMPFSLLLLSLSALSASVGHAGGSGEHGAFACLQDFRTKLHRNHVQLVNDYSNTLAVLSRPEICARLFDAPVSASASAPAGGAKVVVTSAMILALFEQMEAQVSIHSALLQWQKQGRRFRDWNSMLLEFAALKVAADKVQVALEAALESRNEVQKLMQQFEIMEPHVSSAAEIEPRDLDGLLSLPLGAHPIDTLHACFASYQAQGLRFASFEHLVRVVQAELEKSAPQFEEARARSDKKKAAGAAGEDDMPLAAPGANLYTISAPLIIEGEYASAFSEPEPSSNGENSQAVMPSQRKNNKYTLFTADGDASAVAATGGPKSTVASERRNLQQQLNQLAEAQPWLDGCDEAGAEPSAEELIARRYQLFLALSYPASHLFVPRSSPSSGSGSASAAVSDHSTVHLNDDDLDEVLLAAGVHSGFGGGAVALAISFVRELDAEGRRFTSVESLVEAIGERAQRKELTAYLSTFGGLLAELLHTPTVLASGFFERLLAQMPSGGHTPDPMLPLSHYLARTQAFFETRQVAEREAALAAAGGRAKSLVDDGWRPRPVSEETFLATFSHLTIAARRGILASLLTQGIPPFFESLFSPKLASNPSALKAQLTERMLEQMLALQSGSLYRTVRCLKDLEAEDHRFSSAQELLEAMAQQARTRRIAASMSGGALDDQQQHAARGSSRKAAAAAKFAASRDVSSVADDPAALQRRSALFQALSAPQCSLFSQRRDAISLTDRELDETLTLGGGLASTQQHIAAMDGAGLKLRSFDAFLVALSARRQFELCAAYWTKAQTNAAASAADPAAATTFAKNGLAYRYFTEDASSHSGALTQSLFDSMLQAVGGADPALGVLAVLQSLQRIDGSTPVCTALFPSQTELLQALRDEAQPARRRILAYRLFDPRLGNRSETNLSSLLSFACAEAQWPEEQSVAGVADASHPFCRWEGISSHDADELLAACEGSLFFALRHCGSLVRAGYSFSSVSELREAVASVHIFMREEEANQISSSAALPKQKHNNGKLDAAAALARRAMESRRRQSAGPRLPASTKLVFKDDGAGGLSSFDFTEDDEGDLDAQALSDEHRWRAEMDLADVASVRNGKPSTADAFRAALAESELFSELDAGAPMMSVGEVDLCVRAVRGSPSAFRVSLLELERQHQRYTALAPFISDLRALAAQREHDELLVALSFPACKIFASASAAGVEVDAVQLRALIRASSSGRSSLGATKRMLVALDRAGVRFDSMDDLIAGVKALRAERSAAERAARQKEMERVQAAAKAAKAELKQERKAAAAAAATATAPAVSSSGAPLRSAMKKPAATAAAAPPPSEQDILDAQPSTGAVHFDG